MIIQDFGDGPLDLLALQESIAILEQRYELLLKISENNVLSSESRMKDLSDALEKVSSEKDVAQKLVEELNQQMSAKVAELEAELAGVKGERDARAKEKVEGEKAIEELKQQVSAKVAELEAERVERAGGAERVKALEGELAGLKRERDVGEKEKDEAREENELTLLQLYQVQEELERYFLESRAQDDLLRQHQTQSLAMRQVISRLVVCRG